MKTFSILAITTAIVFASITTIVIGEQRVCNAAEIQKKPIVFYHENSDEPQLVALLEEFKYDQYISAGLTEFERMALLKDWVYSRIPYELNFNDSELKDSVQILRRAQKGESFLCTNMSAVFLQCAVSLGWTSRYIFLRKETQEEHAGNDIWSNQYRKWVYIDPTWNIHIEKRNIPLSIHEIRKEWIKNNGKDLVFVFGGGSRMRRYAVRELPIVRNDSKVWQYLPIDQRWLAYTFQVAVVGRNDFFSCCSNNNSSAIWENMYIIQDKINHRDKTWSLLKQGTIASAKKIFHDVNRVDIRIGGHEGKRHTDNNKLLKLKPGPVEVRLTAFGKNNFSPNFMEYMVKIDAGDWKVTSGRFQWRLARGQNIIKARMMNRFGVVGPVTEKRIVIGGKGDQVSVPLVLYDKTVEGTFD